MNAGFVSNQALSLKESVSEPLFYIIIALSCFIFVSLYAVFGGWGERKIIGRSHSRLGPNTTGYFGLLQTVADVIKFMYKSVIFPKGSHKIIFASVPGFMMFFNFIALLFVPFASFTIIDSEYNLIAVFAFLALSPLLMLLASWSSNSKYSTIGGLRAASMIFMYEVLLSMSVAGIFLLTKTFSITKAVEMQTSSVWFIFLQPLGFVLFLIAIIASFERNPFDMTEADSELVSGWRTEYGGIYFAITLFAEYCKIFIGSSLLVSLYLGGWGGFFGDLGFFIKVILVTVLMFYVRAASMRWKMEHLFRRVWLNLIPLAMLNFLATYAVLVML